MSVNKLESPRLLALACGVINMRTFKIECPECKSPAIIKKTHWVDKKLGVLYCGCTEVECGHTFVFHAQFSPTLSPSGMAGAKLRKFLIARLTPEERQIALDLLQGQAS